MKEPIGRVGVVELYVERGDIAVMEADALVNAANNHLWMGSGVAGALKRRGGPEIEREALAKGPIAVGDAVSTTAGDLHAKRVIHAAVMGQDLRTDAETIRSATSSVLRVAADERLGSVAMPAFGTGVGGFPKGEAACQMIAATLDFIRGGPATIKKVVFVAFDDATQSAFADECRRQLGIG